MVRWVPNRCRLMSRSFRFLSIGSLKNRAFKLKININLTISTTPISKLKRLGFDFILRPGSRLINVAGWKGSASRIIYIVPRIIACKFYIDQIVNQNGLSNQPIGTNWAQQISYRISQIQFNREIMVLAVVPLALDTGNSLI